MNSQAFTSSSKIFLGLCPRSPLVSGSKGREGKGRKGWGWGWGGRERDERAGLWMQGEKTTGRKREERMETEDERTGWKNEPFKSGNSKSQSW